MGAVCSVHCCICGHTVCGHGSKVHSDSISRQKLFWQHGMTLLTTQDVLLFAKWKQGQEKYRHIGALAAPLVSRGGLANWAVEFAGC